MIRPLSLTTLCLILLPANFAFAWKKPFKNKTARAANTAYEAAIKKARKEYFAKLEVAVKEAGADGDIEEANRIVAEKQEVEASETGRDLNTVERVRRRLEGTRWVGKSGAWIRLNSNRQYRKRSSSSRFNVLFSPNGRDLTAFAAPDDLPSPQRPKIEIVRGTQNDCYHFIVSGQIASCANHLSTRESSLVRVETMK